MKSCLRQEKYKEDGAAPFNLYVNKCIYMYICKETVYRPIYNAVFCFIDQFYA